MPYRLFLPGLVALLVLTLSGCGTPAETGAAPGNTGDHDHNEHDHGEDAQEAEPPEDAITVPHIHGLAFDGSGEQLIVPAHNGLVIYADGSWSVPAIPKHDYMGFSATDDGFYSSGHPAPGSNMENPFGLVKSTDGGESLRSLAFKGESDFHVMAAGFESHAVYLYNPRPNAGLPAGLHYTVDDGKSWETPAMNGLAGQLIQIAVHPSEPGTVALATDEGLFLSTDRAETFEQQALPMPATAAHFTPDGNNLISGFRALHVYDPASGEARSIEVPAIDKQDGIAFIAVNPVRPAEMAFATFASDIYLSDDSGDSWQQLAEGGTLLP